VGLPFCDSAVDGGVLVGRVAVLVLVPRAAVEVLQARADPDVVLERPGHLRRVELVVRHDLHSRHRTLS
jgi:hypothetical protein